MSKLEQGSMENIELMIEAITSKLKMASAAALKASSFDLDKYEDIKDIYDVIQSKDNFSISEVEAIVSELGKLRKE